KAYLFLSICNVKNCLLKVDDDILCTNGPGLILDAAPLAKTHHYLGKVCDANVEGFARCWHFGKYSDQNANFSPYGFIANAVFANGHAYMLSPRSVRILGKAAIYLEDLFKAERSYEDLAIGKVLNYYGVLPFHLDLIERNILYSTEN